MRTYWSLPLVVGLMFLFGCTAREEVEPVAVESPQPDSTVIIEPEVPEPVVTDEPGGTATPVPDRPTTQPSPTPDPSAETTLPPASPPREQPGQEKPDPQASASEGKLRAAKQNVSIKAGDTAEVELKGVKAGAQMKVDIDPKDKKIDAVLDGNTLKLKAEEDASGEATVKITSGDESATIQVKVEASE